MSPGGGDREGSRCGVLAEKRGSGLPTDHGAQEPPHLRLKPQRAVLPAAPTPVLCHPTPALLGAPVHPTKPCLQTLALATPHLLHVPGSPPNSLWDPGVGTGPPHALS